MTKQMLREVSMNLSRIIFNASLSSSFSQTIFLFLTTGMQGRLAFQSFVLFFEGWTVIVFAHATTLGGAIAVLVFFSIFVQAAEGSSYGIVPYINPTFTGSISGIIGAGGNVGSFAFSFCFRQMSSKNAFLTMGSIILCSSLLSIFININGQLRLLCNKPGNKNEDLEDYIASGGNSTPQDTDEETGSNGSRCDKSDSNGSKSDQ